LTFPISLIVFVTGVAFRLSHALFRPYTGAHKKLIFKKTDLLSCIERDGLFSHIVCALKTDFFWGVRPGGILLSAAMISLIISTFLAR
jgi:hypothetical protein